VPGWHEKTLELQLQEKVQLIGIVQEQHADRTRLFMQWKEMEWPIMVDSLNLLGVSAVPITLLIDEYGIIRAIRPKDEEFRAFLARDFEETELPGPKELDLSELESDAAGSEVGDVTAYADAAFLWKGAEGISESIDYYQWALALDPASGLLHFRLGVAFRERHESELRRADDFLRAVKHWQRALEIDPNQYIWRRRIQQYGPRLDKPYSFYDWVIRARKEIAARGETPFRLFVEPGGAEFASPTKYFTAERSDTREPDPDHKVRRDLEQMIKVESVLVPNTSERESSFRAHVAFYPNSEKLVHWNNEAENMVVWVSPPEGWSVDKQRLVVDVPSEPVSQEVRRVEFELEGPVTLAGEAEIPVYAFYYICEDVDGTCLFRRQDILLDFTRE